MFRAAAAINCRQTAHGASSQIVRAAPVPNIARSQIIFHEKRHTKCIKNHHLWNHAREPVYIFIPEIQRSITVHTAGHGQPRRRGGIRSYKKESLKNEPWRLRDERPTKYQCSIPSFLLCPTSHERQSQSQPEGKTEKDPGKHTLI